MASKKRPPPLLRPMVSHAHSTGFATQAPRKTEAEKGCIKHAATVEKAVGWDSFSPCFLLGASKDAQLKTKPQVFLLPQAPFNQQPLLLPAYWYLAYSGVTCFLSSQSWRRNKQAQKILAMISGKSSSPPPAPVLPAHHVSGYPRPTSSS